MAKVKAQVFHSGKRELFCITEQGKELNCTALATLLKEGHIVVGDNVLIEEKSNSDMPVIVEVFERTNEIFRLIPRESKRKVMAANCDLVAIIVSVSRPEYKQGLLDRYLARSVQWGIPTILIFNKMDQHEESKLDLCWEEKRIESICLKAFEVTMSDLNYRPRFLKNGYQELKDFIRNKTVLFSGQSGVGKSKLINALTNQKFSLKTNELAKVGKGAHTTTWVEMIHFEEFKLIDSPGIRSFSLEDLLVESLIDLFPDLQAISLKCKFNNCEHRPTDKNCAFNKLDKNSQEGQMCLSRLDSYHRILEEVQKFPSWQKKKKN